MGDCLLGGRIKVGLRLFHDQEHLSLLNQIIEQKVKKPHNFLLAGGSQVDFHIFAV